MTFPGYMTVRGDDLELRIKVVPGSRRDELAGTLGDRLKVRVSQPPEGGRANEAIRALIASRFELRVRDIEIVQGSANPLKTLQIKGGAAAATRIAQTIGACPA